MCTEYRDYKAADPHAGEIVFQAYILLTALMEEEIFSEYNMAKFCSEVQRIVTKCRLEESQPEQRP